MKNNKEIQKLSKRISGIVEGTVAGFILLGGVLTILFMALFVGQCQTDSTVRYNKNRQIESDDLRQDLSDSLERTKNRIYELDEAWTKRFEELKEYWFTLEERCDENYSKARSQKDR